MVSLSLLAFFLGFIILIVLAVVLARGPKQKLALDLIQRGEAGGAELDAGGSAASAAGQDDKPKWPLQEYAQAWLAKCGVTSPERFLIKLLIFDVAVSLLVGYFVRPAVGILIFLLVPMGAWLWLLSRANKRNTQIVLALPNFLDGMIRVTRIGASLPAALLAMTKESQGPVRDLFLQVAMRQQAGLSLDQAMAQVGKLYEIKELALIASVLRLNQRYGGRVDLVLERIVEWMRGRVAAQSELAALSAETRLSALMLSVLIPGIAAFIFVYNFQYMAMMLNDPMGRIILMVAAALLVVGIFILMRMSKIRD